MKKEFYSFKQWCEDNSRQDLLDLWDYELNIKNPIDVSYSSSAKYWFKCPRGLHKSIKKDINNLKKKNSKIICPECNTFGQWMLDNLGANAIEKYWSEKNQCSPFDISNNGRIKIWVKHIDNRYPDYSISIRNFRKQRGIPKYNRRIIVKGINDIATTHPYYAQYFLNKEDTYKYSYSSTAYVDIICPICGDIRHVRIDRFTSTPFSCPVCGDNVSYPNKFICEFLNQLKNKNKLLFKQEKIFEWSKNINNTKSRRVYDFYLFEPYKIIIEAHGAQHYNASFCSIPGARTLEKEQENDLFKYHLAINNGILAENYIVLNCSKSNKEWIKKQIMYSALPTKLDFVESDIDWDKCNQIALSSYVFIAAKLWNSGLRNTSLIANEMGINMFTVEKYLHRAYEIGLCDYDSKLVKKYRQLKPILCVEEKIMFSCAQVCESMSIEKFGKYISRSQIQDKARKHKTIYGLHFKYISQQEFCDYKYQNPNLAFGDIYLTV